MPDAYELHDARYIDQDARISAADGLSVSMSTVCPAGRIRTILAAFILPSVAETQTYWFSITRGSAAYPVTVPLSFAADPATALAYPLVREGMEMKLFPGETLTAYRDAAAAGSTIGLYTRYIETDLPLYSYEEPLKKVITKSAQRSTPYLRGQLSEVRPSPTPTTRTPQGPTGGKIGGGPEPV